MVEYLRLDTDLDPLRDDARFEKLARTAEERVRREQDRGGYRLFSSSLISVSSSTSVGPAGPPPRASASASSPSAPSGK